MRIDVIIPAYNARSTLFRALCSIGAQSVAEEVDVTVVDDCSTDGGYTDVIATFQGFLSIRLLRLPENRGPGYARQAGIDRAVNPLIAFVDADDTLFESYSLERLRRALADDGNIFRVSGAVMVMGTGKETLRSEVRGDPEGSVYGRLYRRSFLDRHGIRFPDSRANEDAGFNFLVNMCGYGNGRSVNLKEIVYCVHSNLAGLSHAGKAPFPLDRGFEGYAENMTYAVGEAMKRDVPMTAVLYYAARTMYRLYLLYMKCLAWDPGLAEKNLPHCRKYDQEVFQPLESLVSGETHASLYSQVMAEEYCRNLPEPFIPPMSVRDFLASLRGSL